MFEPCPADPQASHTAHLILRTTLRQVPPTAGLWAAAFTRTSTLGEKDQPLHFIK